MKILNIILLLFVFLAATRGDKITIHSGIVETPESQGIISAWFPTRAGIRYHISRSDDLQNWVETESIYGLGQTHYIPMIMTSQGSQAPSPASAPTTRMSGTLTPVIGESGNYYLSWVSAADHSLETRRFKLIGLLSSSWNGVPLSWRLSSFSDASSHPGSNGPSQQLILSRRSCLHCRA